MVDGAQLPNLSRLGVTPGNLLSMLVTLLTGAGIVLGGVWTARGMLDGVQQDMASIAARQVQADLELKRLDTTRQNSDRALFDALSNLNRRIDNLYNGRRGALPGTAPDPGGSG